MTSPATSSSTPPSPQAPTLHLPVLARMLLWKTRRRSQPEAIQQESNTAPAPASPPPTSPPPSPKSRTKPHLIECSSGLELKTHDRLVDGKPECRKNDVITHQDVFVCLNGVDTARLLLFSRKRVFERVELLGGNAIIDERWSCTICKHQTRHGIMYKVSIQYQGTPARCVLPDPQRPVAANEAKGVPGLMTIVSRQ